MSSLRSRCAVPPKCATRRLFTGPCTCLCAADTGFGWYGLLDQLQPGLGYLLKCSSGGIATVGGGSARRLGGDDLADAPLNTHTTFPVPSSHPWFIDTHKYEHTSSLTAIVSVGGSIQQHGILAAMIGGTVHGVAIPSFQPAPLGPFQGMRVFDMMVHAHPAAVGQPVAFRFEMISANGSTRVLDLSSTIAFAADGQTGSLMKPIQLEFLVPPSASPTFPQMS